jgi:glycosyltransferase involved in cell wall biosynthesis
MKPQISIGLPVYNGEQYIETTIKSVLAQTCSDFDLIISDNASTDRTQAICSDYRASDPRIRYIRNEINLGAAKNFNNTFHASSGAYFKWIAYDDPIAPTFLERCLQALEQHPEAVISYPKAYIINEHSEIVEEYSDHLHLQSPVAHLRFKKILFQYGLCNPIFGLMRRSVLQKTPLIGDYPYSDRKLLAELALYGELYEIPEYLLYRREHPLVSTRVNQTEKELAAWFNPASAGKKTSPIFKRYSSYFTAIVTTQIPVVDKFFCLAYLLQLAFKRNKWGAILKDATAVLPKTRAS